MLSVINRIIISIIIIAIAAITVFMPGMDTFLSRYVIFLILESKAMGCVIDESDHARNVQFRDVIS